MRAAQQQQQQLLSEAFLLGFGQVRGDGVGSCTPSSSTSSRLARQAGADEVILYSEQDFETEVKRITDGAGVNVAYDSVGKSTFEKSIDCLSRFGYMVLYGNASGPVTEFNPATLGPKGSLFQYDRDKTVVSITLE